MPVGRVGRTLRQSHVRRLVGEDKRAIYLADRHTGHSLRPLAYLTTLPRPMKAERRHQLQENSLVHALEAAPFFFRRYGTQILLGLLVIILVIVLIRNRAANAQLTEDECRKS